LTTNLILVSLVDEPKSLAFPSEIIFAKLALVYVCQDATRNHNAASRPMWKSGTCRLNLLPWKSITIVEQEFSVFRTSQDTMKNQTLSGLGLLLSIDGFVGDGNVMRERIKRKQKCMVMCADWMPVLGYGIAGARVL